MREALEEFREGPLRVRRHGSSGPTIIVLHGGPAAVGEAAPIARGLSATFHVLEPWQRGSGEAPLSVAVHVADLYALVRTRSDQPRPALVGESWGAMLALAYAAAHPEAAGPLVLIGCGTFDPLARARMRAILEERTDDELRRRLARLSKEVRDPEESLRRRYELTDHLYLYDPLEEEDGLAHREPLDVRAHSETWSDMLRLQHEGVYPSAFSAIRSPVLMLHGAYDPHPGPMIRASLEPFLPQLEYREWSRCGHSPWREKAVRDEFFRTMQDWLTERLAEGR